MVLVGQVVGPGDHLLVASVSYPSDRPWVDPNACHHPFVPCPALATALAVVEVYHLPLGLALCRHPHHHHHLCLLCLLSPAPTLRTSLWVSSMVEVLQESSISLVVRTNPCRLCHTQVHLSLIIRPRPSH